MYRRVWCRVFLKSTIRVVVNSGRRSSTRLNYTTRAGVRLGSTSGDTYSSRRLNGVVLHINQTGRACRTRSVLEKQRRPTIVASENSNILNLHRSSSRYAHSKFAYYFYTTKTISQLRTKCARACVCRTRRNRKHSDGQTVRLGSGVPITTDESVNIFGIEPTWEGYSSSLIPAVDHQTVIPCFCLFQVSCPRTNITVTWSLLLHGTNANVYRLHGPWKTFTLRLRLTVRRQFIHCARHSVICAF